MKSNTLVVIFMLFTLTVSAQNDTKARLEYENAEEAFANKNYSLALEKIKLTEQLLKKSNPKTQYLTILTLNSIANQYQLEKKYQEALTSLEEMEPVASKYLKLDISDQQKYRDIYNIHEEVAAKRKTIQKKLDVTKNLGEYLKAYYANYNKTFEERGIEQIEILLKDIPNNMTTYLSSLPEKQREKKLSKHVSKDSYYYKGIAFDTELISLYGYETELLKQGDCKFKNGKFTKIAISTIGLRDNGDVASVDFRLGVNMDNFEKMDILANDFISNFMKVKADYKYQQKYYGETSGDCYVWYFKGYSLLMEKKGGRVDLKLFKHFPENAVANWNGVREFSIEGETFKIPTSNLKDLIDSN